MQQLNIQIKLVSLQANYSDEMRWIYTNDMSDI